MSQNRPNRGLKVTQIDQNKKISPKLTEFESKEPKFEATKSNRPINGRKSRPKTLKWNPTEPNFERKRKFGEKLFESG